MIRIVLTAALALTFAAPAVAQTLMLMKGIDAPHYDGQRTTWGPTSDIVNMFQDTLVALDWDEHLWMPVLNFNMDQVANKKISGARPHMIYQNTFYKGLDVTR
jgi:hypothetical protein